MAKLGMINIPYQNFEQLFKQIQLVSQSAMYFQFNEVQILNRKLVSFDWIVEKNRG